MTKLMRLAITKLKEHETKETRHSSVGDSTLLGLLDMIGAVMGSSKNHPVLK